MRTTIRCLGVFCALFLMLIAQASAAHAEVGAVDVIRSTPDEVVLRLDVPDPEVTPFGDAGESKVRVIGWPVLEDEGAPALPVRGALIGIPADAALDVSVSVLGRRVLAGVDPAPAPKHEILDDDSEFGLPTQRDLYLRDLDRYRSIYPAEWASAERSGTLRQLPVARVEFRPFRWNPALGGVEMATAIEVTVRFVREATREDQGLWRRPGDDHPVWESEYDSAVLNWNEARAFRRAPVTWKRTQFRRTLGGDVAEEMRLDINETGIYRVTFNELEANGWAAGEVAVRTLALEERGFDDDAAEDPFVTKQIPIHVVDADGDGNFESGDAIYFYGVDYWTRYDPIPRVKRLGRPQSYFFLSRDEGGARMPTVPSSPDVAGLTPVDQFLWTERNERSERYMVSRGSGEDATPQRIGVENIIYDRYYWFGGRPAEGDRAHIQPFDLPGFRQLERLRIPLQGVTDPPNSAASRPAFEIGPDEQSLTAIGDTLVLVKGFVLFERGSSTLAGIELNEEDNIFRMEVPAVAYGCAVDYLEWTYHKGVMASGDVFTWASGDLAGVQEYRVSRFSGTDVVALDVTDPDNPVHLSIAAGQWSGSGASRVLTLQLDMGDGSVSRTYEARRPGAALAVPAMAPTSSEDLTQAGSENLVIITHQDFRAGLAPLIAQRESQGWNVGVVTMQEVADQFNGGRRWPDAIRNYLRYLFRTRETPPGFLLLVGDASEDFIGEVESSGTNFVPTQTLFSNAFSSQGVELIAVDHWFVDNLTGTDETLDFFADMHIGRLPVGTQTELTNVVAKIVDYADFSDDDRWRNRGLFMSDDAFSNRIGFDGDYVYWGAPPSGDESVFIWAAQESKRIIKEAGFTDFVADTFFLASYLDSVPCLERCLWDDNGSSNCDDWTCPIENGQVTEFNEFPISDGWPRTQTFVNNSGLHTRLHQQMSRGHLFVSFQGHANRALATHEDIYRDQPFGSRRDSERIQNTGRPFIFMGFGCHMTEFAFIIEDDPRQGDCFTELLMFLPDGRGAVAAMASTAYEWLGENARFNRNLIESWFASPPRDGSGGDFGFEDGQTRWLLGDLYNGGKVRLVTELSNGNTWGMVNSYVLLGDPTLMVDLAPPRAESILVNGEEYDGASPLTSVAESDSATIQVLLYDEAWLQSFRVRHDGQEADPSLVTVEPNPEFPTDDRKAMVTYRAPLDVPLNDYEIEVVGADRAGRERVLRFPVRLVTAFELLREDGYESIDEGDFLIQRDSLRVTVASPVRLGADDLEVYFDDQPLDATAVSEDGGEAAWSWSLFAQLPGSIDEGAHRIDVRVRQVSGVGTAARGLTVEGSSTDRVSLLELYNFPNPFEDDTRFFYTIDGPAERARVSIFTLRGAKIRVLEGRARAGENVVSWDGRDADGDAVANGVYFYKLEVDLFEGGKLTKIDRVARIR